MSILRGEYRFFDNGQLTNDPDHWKTNDGTNSESEDFVSSLWIGRHFNLHHRIKLNLIAGLGMYFNITSYVLRFDYGNRISWEPFYIGNWSVNFPVNVVLNYKLIEKVDLVLKSGAFIEPDFPIMGIHLGGGVNYIF